MTTKIYCIVSFRNKDYLIGRGSEIFKFENEELRDQAFIMLNEGFKGIKDSNLIKIDIYSNEKETLKTLDQLAKIWKCKKLALFDQ